MKRVLFLFFMVIISHQMLISASMGRSPIGNQQDFVSSLLEHLIGNQTNLDETAETSLEKDSMAPQEKNLKSELIFEKQQNERQRVALRDLNIGYRRLQESFRNAHLQLRMAQASQLQQLWIAKVSQSQNLKTISQLHETVNQLQLKLGGIQAILECTQNENEKLREQNDELRKQIEELKTEKAIHSDLKPLSNE